jgi:iron complex transport system substrate-binding protein
MNKKRLTAWMASTAIVMSVLLTACGQVNQNTDSAPKKDADTQKPAATVYPLTITDATGKKITIQEEPKRIVSLIPSNTEILYALGLGDKVVGVTKWDDYPPEVKKKPVIGDLKPNAEAIVAQKPDLVLAGASANGKDLDALRSLGLNVVAFEPKTIKDVEETIREVGKITNTEAKAEEVVNGMEAKIKTVTEKTQGLSDDKKPRVYVEVSPAPDIFTAGEGTFMDEMVTLAGGKNIAGDLKGWAKISGEQVIAKNPQVIIITHGLTPDSEKSVLHRSGWSGLDAVKNHRIVSVDTNLVSRPGPRIVDGLAEFAKAIHPELFK